MTYGAASWDEDRPTATIAVATRGRPAYLAETLDGVVPQALRLGAEVVVVADGPDQRSEQAAAAYELTYRSLSHPRGANAARNEAARVMRSDLLVLIDDDVLVPEGWLEALLEGVAGAPDREVFGGPIRVRLEGRPPRGCGRDRAPITTLELGGQDRDAPFVWSANMAIRRAALQRVGEFDETISVRGDEEDWLRRFQAGGGRVRYLASAGLYHRRAPADATLISLSRSAFAHGRASRRFDARKHAEVPLRRELRVLAGTVGHVVRRRCALGLVTVAHSAGRTWEATRTGWSHVPHRNEDDDFLSGTAGHVAGIRITGRAVVSDALDDLAAFGLAQSLRLRQRARAQPRRKVLALGIERSDMPNLLAQSREELLGSRHQVRFLSTEMEGRGRFENLNRMLSQETVEDYDWLLVVDDDAELPPGFLDTFLLLVEHFGLQLAQPAHRHRSHAAFAVTRRRRGTLVRETRFVEIGPVVAFSRLTFDVLLPFPSLRFGWGLDAHWSAVAQRRGWRIGVVDATPVRHGLRKVAASYDTSEARQEARVFLSKRPYVRAVDGAETLAVHRRLGG